METLLLTHIVTIKLIQVLSMSDQTSMKTRQHNFENQVGTRSEAQDPYNHITIITTTIEGA